MIFTLLGAVFALVSLVCWLIVTIDAFKSAIWKGILCIIGCGLYWLYYAIFEFQHDNKWLIVLVAIFGGGIGSALFQMGR